MAGKRDEQKSDKLDEAMQDVDRAIKRVRTVIDSDREAHGDEADQKKGSRGKPDKTGPGT